MTLPSTNTHLEMKTEGIVEPTNISEIKSGSIRVEPKKSSWSEWLWVPLFSWKWKPTSTELLEKAESNILKSVQVNFEQKQIVTENHVINTIKLGNGPPLVLLHGFGAGIGFWVCNYTELAKHHTIYAIDLPGFGRSSRPTFNGKSVEEAEEYFISSIEQWRKKMELNEKFSLLGHSFGAYLASVYSLQFPENIHHLILADPWGIPAMPPESQNNKNLPLRWRIMRRVITLFNPLAIIRAAGPYGPGLITRFRKDIEEKFKHVFPDTSVISQYIYHLNAQTPSGEIAFSTLNEKLGWAKKPMFDRLPNLHPSIPVTLLYGANSWMDRQAGERLKEQLGNRAKYYIVPSSGHHIYADNYQFFNECIINGYLTASNYHSSQNVQL